MNPASNVEIESLGFEDGDDVVSMIKRLADGRLAGILGTVDQDGKPEVRWMSTLAFDEFPNVYTLTAPDSRKVRQIKQHPDVNWLFFDDDKTLTVNLIGKALVLTDTPTLKRIWRQVEDKSHAYFLNQYSKGPGFVVIKTTIESIECSWPKHARRLVVKPSAQAHAANHL
jgi:general stress protein 26